MELEAQYLKSGDTIVIWNSKKRRGTKVKLKRVNRDPETVTLTPATGKPFTVPLKSLIETSQALQ